MKPAKSAAREAYEEAGVRGTVGGKAIGKFSYEKRRDDESSAVPCEVLVFPLLVKRQLKAWPEANKRELRWFDPADAASRVEEEGLRKLINFFTAKENGDGTRGFTVNARRSESNGALRLMLGFAAWNAGGLTMAPRFL